VLGEFTRGKTAASGGLTQIPTVQVYTGGDGCKWWADVEKGEMPCMANIQGAVQDEFFLAHIIGWWGKVRRNVTSSLLFDRESEFADSLILKLFWSVLFSAGAHTEARGGCLAEFDCFRVY